MQTQHSVSRCLCIAFAMGACHANGQEVDASKLRQIELRLMPACLRDGPARYSNLPEYYWAENADLKKRFERAKHAYHADEPAPFHALTLVAGAAGVGKTFIKGNAFDKRYAPDAVCKIDIKELYVEWLKTGQTVNKPDLASGKVVLSQLPAARKRGARLLAEYLSDKQPAFVIVDSLDEVHPDDYVSLLEQLEQYAFDDSRRFAHVVVFARTLAFVEYWTQRSARQADIALLELKAPVFQTTGDLLVSSWNYHVWRYNLSWAPEGGESVPLPWAAYQQWAERGFDKRGRFESVTYKPNQNISRQVHATLQEWTRNHCRVTGMLGNLAGNGMLREIVEDFAVAGRDYEESAVLRAYFAAWLQRDARTDGRPDGNHRQLDLYLRLLEGVALKYAPAVDAEGYFPVRPEDTVTVTRQGESLPFPVQRILDRSGLKQIALPLSAPTRYRFEPLWLHRVLWEQHAARNPPDRVTVAAPSSN